MESLSICVSSVSFTSKFCLRIFRGFCNFHCKDFSLLWLSLFLGILFCSYFEWNYFHNFFFIKLFITILKSYSFLYVDFVSCYLISSNSLLAYSLGFSFFLFFFLTQNKKFYFLQCWCIRNSKLN
jgi:hypothetical protein